MILADTNIYIDIFKGRGENLRSIFLSNEICTCGVVYTELLRGSRNKDDFESIKKILDNFRYLNFKEDYWIYLSEIFVLLRENSVSVPFQDAMIATLAIKNGCEVLTFDKHFKSISNVIEDLKLYKIE